MSNVAEKELMAPTPIIALTLPLSIPVARRQTIDGARNAVALAMRIADVVLIVVAGVISLPLQDGLPQLESSIGFQIIIAALLGVMIFECTGLHRWNPTRMTSSLLLQLVSAWAVVLIALLMLDRLLGVSNYLSLKWFAGFSVTGLGLLFVERLAVDQWTAVRLRDGAFTAVVAAVGFPAMTRRLVDRLAHRVGKEIHIAGIFDLSRHGDIENLIQLCREATFDEVLLALPPEPSPAVDFVLRALANFPIKVQLVPELPNAAVAHLCVGEVVGLPAISIINRPLSDSQLMLKRMEDIFFSLLIIAAAAPLMLPIALLIKLDSQGPVIFRQERWGFNFAPIKVLKFRTMYVAAAADPLVIQAQRVDARVTRIGYWLRRLSFDELPQLFNVLRGDMSLVGPRPHAIPHNEQYAALIDNYLARNKLKPGMTGLAQVNGYRGVTDTLEKMQKRVEFDLLYMKDWSLLLDLKILIRTLVVGFSHPNAF